MSISRQVQKLVENGAAILHPESVYIGPEVNVDALSKDLKLFPGCRIIGQETSIGKCCVLGQNAPVTIEDCQLASRVSLQGGTFTGATLLSDVSFGPSAHVRAATIMEEQSSCAHSVGLKQTVLFPFVTLGSLINFCDCFMSGGTSRQNHSEVGSSFVHFNYTPHRDKATPSLIGDVARGVMQRQQPIFLGGQGGLVGPTTIEFGTITAAGSCCRKDISRQGMLVYGKPMPTRHEHPYQPGVYGSVARIIDNNLRYIGNLFALLDWYNSVRSLFIDEDYPASCHKGAVNKILQMISERKDRMAQLAGNMPHSIELTTEVSGMQSNEKLLRAQNALYEQWPELEKHLNPENIERNNAEKSAFIDAIGQSGLSYMKTIHSLDDATAETGSNWLSSIVNSTIELWKTEEPQ